MNRLIIKISIIVGLMTAAVMLFYEAGNLLVVYKYFRFDYYFSAAVLIALISGMIIARKLGDKIISSDNENLIDKLTNKELQILLLISQGKTNKEIALQNFVEVSTVKTHINNIYAKLGINNRKQAACLYEQYKSTGKSILSPPATI